jgi:hypothetical protein
MAVNLSPVGGAAAQFFNNDGLPLAGGFIYTYLAGTNTPATTYTTASGAIAHSNPIVLDSAGRIPTGELWLTNGTTYKFVIEDSNNVLIGTYDNIGPANFIGFKGQIGTVENLAGNDGSNWIGFIQAGTGAVAISAQDKMRQIVDVQDFGADPTGVANSSSAFSSAATYCYANNKTLRAVGNFRLQSSINLRYICLDMANASFNIAHSGIGVYLGGNASSANNPFQHFGSVTRSVGTDSYTTPSIRCIGAKGQHIIVEYTNYFQIWADTNSGVAPTDYSTAYSSFVLKVAFTVELTSNPSSSGSSVQWINENFFWLNRTNNLLISGTYGHNNNYFQGGCFEGTSIIDIQTGQQNYIRDIRQEGTLDVTFGTTAYDNIVTIGWSSSSHRYPSGGVTVVNNGGMNAVQHNFDVYAPITPIVGFNYQTLKKVSSNYNIIGVSNVTVGASNLSVVGFTDFYTSVLIPINGENSVFEINIYDVVSGGIRTRVDGYDSTKTLITPAPGQVTYDGSGDREFGQDDNGSNTVDFARFYVLDKNCKYIVVTVKAGGAGATFCNYYFGVRVPDIALRKKMASATYAINNFV